jgi:hypothetical protein
MNIPEIVSCVLVCRKAPAAHLHQARILSKAVLDSYGRSEESPAIIRSLYCTVSHFLRPFLLA